MLRNVYCGTYFTHVQTYNNQQHLKPPWGILETPFERWRLQAPFKPPLSTLQGEAPSSPLSPLQAPLKPPSRWSPLQAPWVKTAIVPSFHKLPDFSVAFFPLWENILQDLSRGTGNIFAIFLECQANLRESAHVASHKFIWTWQNKNTPAFGKSEDESSRTSSVN